MKRNISIIYLLFLIVCVLVMDNTISINANSSLIENNIDYSMADKNEFELEGIRFNIQNYNSSIIGINNLFPEINLYGKNVEFTEGPFGQEMTVLKDDPIVKMIPKELFKIPNHKKIHIGKEYGFFISTKELEGVSDVIYANVYFFDLIFDNFTSPSHYKFSVVPLFQREYVYFATPKSNIKTQVMYNDFLSGKGEYSTIIRTNIQNLDVVAPLPYEKMMGYFNYADNIEYFMRDVKNILTLANEQHLNFGDANYSPVEDKGMFITQQDIKYKASIHNVNSDPISDAKDVVLESIWNEALGDLIGEIPGASTIKSSLEKIYATYSATLDTIEKVENQLTYKPNYVTSDGQINATGQLAKTAISKLDIDYNKGNYGEGSYLYYDMGDFVTFDYQLGYTPEYENSTYKTPWETRIIRGLTIDFTSYRDNSTETHGDISNFETKNEPNREYKDLKENNIVSLLPNGENLFRFTPARSGNYVFTANNSQKTNLEILSGEYSNFVIKSPNQNVMHIEVDLQKDMEYIFKIKYDDKSLKGYFNLYFNINPQIVLLGNNSLELKYLQNFYSFTPQHSIHYRFIVNNQIIINVYDENFQLIQNYNDEKYFQLIKNKKYYIMIENINDQNLVNLLIEDQTNITYYKNNNSSTVLNNLNFSLTNNDRLFVPQLIGYKFLGWTTYSNDTLINENNIHNYLILDLKLYAKWEVIEYNIYFYGRNSELISQDKYTIETGFNLDRAPSIEGYIILDWYDENGNKVMPDNSATGIKHCYPQVVQNKSFISLNLKSEITDEITAKLSNNAEINQKYEVAYGQKITFPYPSVLGFEFNGWYVDGYPITNHLGEMYPNFKFLEDTEIYAEWTRTSYYFTINPEMVGNDVTLGLKWRKGINEYDVILNPSAFTADKKFIIVAEIRDALKVVYEETLINQGIDLAFYKKGYIFDGFSLALNEEKISSFSIDELNNGIILYPYHVAKSYIVTYGMDQSNPQNPDLKVVHLTFNGDWIVGAQFNFDIRNCFKEGYKFNGLKTATGNLIFDKNMQITENGFDFLLSFNTIDYELELVSTPVPIHYTIRYESGFSEKIISNNYQYDQSYTLPSGLDLFDREGYNFIGWKYENLIKNPGDTFSNLTAVEGMIFSYVAQWERIVYSIILENQGYREEFKVDHGTSYTLPVENKTYYAGNWQDKDSGETYQFGSNFLVTSDRSFTSVWTPINYYINYSNLMGAYNSNSTVYNVNTNQSLRPLSLTNYVFDGWFLDKNFTTSVYVVNINLVKYTTLYAKWTLQKTSTVRGTTLTIEDSGEAKNPMDSINIMSLLGKSADEFNKLGFINYLITISLDIWEEDDGYQHIYVYNQNNALLSSLKMEHGPGKKDGVSKNYIVANFTLSQLPTYLYIKYDASGSLGDTWCNRNLKITIQSTQKSTGEPTYIQYDKKTHKRVNVDGSFTYESHAVTANSGIITNCYFCKESLNLNIDGPFLVVDTRSVLYSMIYRNVNFEIIYLIDKEWELFVKNKLDF